MTIELCSGTLLMMKYTERGSLFGPVGTMRYSKLDNEGTRYDGELTIQFGPNPYMVYGRSLTSITDPNRFGSWETRSARKKYMEAFLAD